MYINNKTNNECALCGVCDVSDSTKCFVWLKGRFDRDMILKLGIHKHFTSVSCGHYTGPGVSDLAQKWVRLATNLTSLS